jgi:hypothetical protein
MMVAGSRMRQIGWLASIGLCVGLFAVLSFNVHAVKSEVLLAERQIVSLERQTMLLETEFETRASQHQLATWNAVEFGYEAPRADQYIDGERQLASLGLPATPGAPSPIRVARADGPQQAQSKSGDKPRQEMVSPISGETITLAAAKTGADSGSSFTDAFGDFLIEASPIRSAQAQTRHEAGE